MRFRTRLFLLTALTVAVTIALVIWTASTSARRSFELLDEQRTDALVSQFQQEFARGGQETVRRAEGIARAESIRRIAIEASRPKPNYARFYNEAATLAAEHDLDFLEIVTSAATIVSSAHWAARFGYEAEWPQTEVDWNRQNAFLRRLRTPDGAVLALVAVRSVEVAGRQVLILAGVRVGPAFLRSLALPDGMRALLVPLLGADPPPELADDLVWLRPLVDEVRSTGEPLTRVLSLPGGDERFHALPLHGREDDLLGVLLIGSSRHELTRLIRRLRLEGLAVGGAGVLLGLVFSFGIAARFTRPLERLASGARRVAAGDWETQVDVRTGDEVEQLAADFNSMTRQLIEQRDRAVQAERVAAWRELARRLAHELKNPLFPLQITVENLQRVRQQAPEQFEEVFLESTSTLLQELKNLNVIIGRFSDFAKMPPPEKQPLDLNRVVRDAVRLFDAQFRAEGRASVDCVLDLDPELGKLNADPHQMGILLRNLILNAIDVMRDGGKLTVRTRGAEPSVSLEVTDTGEGLTPEECERLFTPYYTTKQHGTGLGLAVVQSVVSDHRGRISVTSAPGQGATFTIELPRE